MRFNVILKVGAYKHYFLDELAELEQLANNAEADSIITYIAKENCSKYGLLEDDTIHFIRVNSLEDIPSGSLVLTFDYDAWIYSRNSNGITLTDLSEEENTITIKNDEIDTWMNGGGIIAVAKVIIKNC